MKQGKVGGTIMKILSGSLYHYPTLWFLLLPLSPGFHYQERDLSLTVYKTLFASTTIFQQQQAKSVKRPKTVVFMPAPEVGLADYCTKSK